MDQGRGHSPQIEHPRRHSTREGGEALYRFHQMHEIYPSLSPDRDGGDGGEKKKWLAVKVSASRAPYEGGTWEVS